MQREGAFIFWLVVLSLAVSDTLSICLSVNPGPLLKVFTSFCRQELIVFFVATLTALVIYVSLRKFPFIHNSLKNVILCVSFCVFALDLFTVYQYDLTFNTIMLDIAMMTNFREGSEFLGTYLANGKFWLFVAAVFCAIIILRAIYGLFMRSRRVAVILFWVLFVAGALTTLREKIVHADDFRKTMLQANAVSRLHHMYMADFRAKRDFQRMLASAPAEVELTRNDSSIPYVVFILGESTSRNHLSLYGYELETSPRLSKRKGLYAFTDAVSPHSHTNAVMQELFTFCTYGSQDVWYSYTSLFAILGKAGYFTAWLSNQELSIGGQPAKLYSGQCDVRVFTDELRDNWDSAIFYDGLLLPILDDVLAEQHHDKNFYVLHIMGTHANYRKRFPPEWAKFSAQDEGGFSGITPSQKRERATYDNAVLYNDFIVDEIIRRFEDKNAIVIYVSDHGEEVYDTMDFQGHGVKLINRNSIEIPMIVWLSESFSQTYPQLSARIASSVDRPYMTDDMIHTLLDIMSIETPDFDPAKSVIHPSFDITRPRIYSGHVYTKEAGLVEMNQDRKD